MLLFRACLTALFSAALLVAAGAPSAYGAHIHRAPTSGTVHHKRTLSTHSRRHRAYRRHARLRGQQAIQPERVTEIQQALIRAHYMSGDASGKWDTSTIAAMQKYQADHGWQTKIMPDSRALVKLGLGEDYSSAINAKNLSLAGSPSGATIPPDQEAGFAAAAGASQ